MFKLQTLLLSIGLLCAAPIAMANSAYNLGVAGNFSAFVFGDMNVTSSTDALHSVAVQGNFTAGTWTAAQGGATYSTGGKDWALVVGGNINWSNGSVQSGATYVGGSLTVGGPYNPTLGYVQQGGTSPVDFAAAKTQLQAESTRLANISPTGNVLYGTQKAGGSTNSIYLQGSNKSVEYFTIDSAKLAVGNIFTELKLDTSIAAGATIILNITGSATEIAMGNLSSLLNFGGHETLLNFGSNISKITLGSLNADASVLAYNAAVVTSNGNQNGTVIAKSFTDGSQLNGGKASSSTPNNIPEPASIALAGLALVGIGWQRRRAR